MTPGLAALLSLLRPVLATRESDVEPAIGLPNDVEPDEVLAAARRHRVVPQLARVVAERPGAFRASFRASVHEAAELNARMCLSNLVDHIAIDDLLSKAGIPSIPLKGIVLAQQLFGSPSARSAGDIDVWVQAERFSEANSALLAAGFLPKLGNFRLSDRRLKYMLRSGHQWSYRTPRGGLLELHWKLHDVPSLLPITFETVLSGGDKIRLGPWECVGFPPDALYAYLLSHGAREHWGRLSWIFDAWHLAASDRHGARAVAKHFGVERMHDRLMQMTRELGELGAEAGRNRAKTLPLELTAEQPIKPIELGLTAFIARLQYFWNLRADAHYRLDFVRTQFLRPRMIEVLSLPERLIPYSWLLRPYTFFTRARIAKRLPGSA